MKALLRPRWIWLAIGLLALIVASNAYALASGAFPLRNPLSGPESSGPAVTVALVPRATAARAGDDLAVDVTISTTEPLRGAQFAMKFDPELVEVRQVDEGSFFKGWAGANGAETFVLPQQAKADNRSGSLAPVGITILGSPNNPGPVGSGVLATVHVVVKGRSGATTRLALVNVTAANMNSMGQTNRVPGVAVTDAQLTVGGAQGGLGIDWSPVSSAGQKAP
jgi:hypothetical protein